MLHYELKDFKRCEAQEMPCNQEHQVCPTKTCSAVGKCKSRSYFLVHYHVPEAVLNVKGLKEGKTSLGVASWLAYITWARR